MRSSIFVYCLLTVLFESSALLAGGCTRLFPGLPSLSLTGIRLEGDMHPALDAAAAQWNFCGGMIPGFTTDQSPSFPTAPVTVHLSTYPVPTFCDRPGESFCGCARGDIESGTLIGGEIWAFENSNLQDCGDYEQVIAHELGHILGLNEACGATCLGRIMWDVFPAPPAVVTSQECAALDFLWTTAWESPDPCDWPDPPPGCDDGQGGGGYGFPPQSPILLDLDSDGFHLTGLGDSVVFDIDADEKPESVAWTKAGSRDAFLWLDRNSNGLVDDGNELFGNHTRLQDGSVALHGYQALSEFDNLKLGGNQDGFLDRNDAVFQDLSLWIDRNHDGYSDPGEIRLLTHSKIVRLDLSYRMLIESDEHGNIYKYLSRAWVQRGTRIKRILTTDVFFLTVQ